MYTKTVDGETLFSNCLSIVLNGVKIVQPTPEQIAEAGWVKSEISQNREPTAAKFMASIKNLLMPQLEELSDEKALSVINLYPTWDEKINKHVEAKDRLWYNDKLYRVLQPHLVQEQWAPNMVPALYAEVSLEEWPEWVLPISAETAYKLSDKVSHNGIHWISDVDNNVWEPGVYGWSEVTD